MAGLPESPGANANALRSSRTPAFCFFSPWHSVQRCSRMGRTSRWKSTVAAEDENSAAQKTADNANEAEQRMGFRTRTYPPDIQPGMELLAGVGDEVTSL